MYQTCPAYDDFVWQTDGILSFSNIIEVVDNQNTVDTATPKSAMKPTPAEIFERQTAQYSAAMPPMGDRGTVKTTRCGDARGRRTATANEHQVPTWDGVLGVRMAFCKFSN